MNYIDVDWIHNNPEDPIRLVSELDAERFEQRKLEFFRDGRVEFARPTTPGKVDQHARAMLGTAPVPPVEVINLDPQFRARQVSATYFNTLWLQHAHSDA